MNESQTPYVKIEQERQGGFGDINIPTDIELTDTTATTETVPLTSQLVVWDSLFTFEFESCFLSYYVPCHVIGKISRKIGIGYPSLFCLYAFFFFMLNYSYYVFAYAITPVCNNNHYSDWCFLIYDKSQCKKTYTIMNDQKTMCDYNHEYHTCYASNEACISTYESKTTWGSWCFLEIISISVLSITHVYIRRQLKKTQHIHQDTICKDILYSLFCTTCSLGQQYRSLDIN